MRGSLTGFTAREISNQNTADANARKAKRWGLANGYKGAAGGWIYRDGVPVVQGWLGLYLRHREAIERTPADSQETR